MKNFLDAASKISFSKNLLTEQNWRGITTKFNTAGLDFDVSEGLGDSTATSSLFFISVGGFDNQRIVADLKYMAPTTAGSEDIGVMLRCSTVDGSDDNYYFARVDSGTAKITKIVDAVFTTISSTPFVLPQNEVVTIDFQIVGSQLDASFTASTPGSVSLSATDSSVPPGGVFGIRSTSSTLWCRNFTVSQL